MPSTYASMYVSTNTCMCTCLHVFHACFHVAIVSCLCMHPQYVWMCCVTGCGYVFICMCVHALTHTVCKSACADMHMNDMHLNTSVLVKVIIFLLILINCN